MGDCARMMRLALLVLAVAMLGGCTAPPTPSQSAPPASRPPSPNAAASPSPAPSLDHPLGAGFRFSTYGPAYDPGPAYWSRVGREMADRFPGSRPQAIWIVGNFSGTGTVLTFPGEFDGGLINFSPRDRNEPALSAFDEIGLDVSRSNQGTHPWMS